MLMSFDWSTYVGDKQVIPHSFVCYPCYYMRPNVITLDLQSHVRT